MERYLDVIDQDKRTKEHETEGARYSGELSAEEETRYQDFMDRYEDEGLSPRKK